MLTESANYFRHDAAQQPTTKTPNGQRFGVGAFLPAQSWNSGGASLEFNALLSNSKIILIHATGGQWRRSKDFSTRVYSYCGSRRSMPGHKSTYFLTLEEMNE